MFDTLQLYRKLSSEVSPQAAEILAESLGAMYGELKETVTKSDFAELKSVVSDLAQAQQRTEKRVEELAEAQRKTEETVRSLVEGQKQIRSDLGALQQNFSYAFENEAYRMLPSLLEARFGFHTRNRLLREYLGDLEINFLAHGEVDGRETLLVGESKQRIRPSDVTACREQLATHLEAVRNVHGDLPIIQIIVTHTAHPRAIQALKSHNIHVIQSHEW